LLPLRCAQGFGSRARNDIVQSYPESEPITFQTYPEQLQIEIVPVAATPFVGMAWIRELYEMFAPVRQEGQMMDKAIIDLLIDEAVDEVRSQGDD